MKFVLDTFLRGGFVAAAFGSPLLHPQARIAPVVTTRARLREKMIGTAIAHQTRR
jgi:hypothetical protein